MTKWEREICKTNTGWRRTCQRIPVVHTWLNGRQRMNENDWTELRRRTLDKERRTENGGQKTKNEEGGKRIIQRWVVGTDVILIRVASAWKCRHSHRKSFQTQINFPTRTTEGWENIFCGVQIKGSPPRIHLLWRTNRRTTSTSSSNNFIEKINRKKKTAWQRKAYDVLAGGEKGRGFSIQKGRKHLI